MRIVKKDNLFIVKDFFSQSVSAGFTAPVLKGELPDSLNYLKDTLGKDLKFAYLNQKHAAQVNLVKTEGILEGDGLITTALKLCLIVKSADCLPLLFESKDPGIIGAIHMGWRSALAGILDNPGIDLSGCKFMLGVGLRSCCYQVGEEFLAREAFKPFIGKRNRDYYFSPVDFAFDCLVKKGVSPVNIYDLNICSHCSGRNFFSFRRDKTLNRTLSFIFQV